MTNLSTSVAASAAAAPAPSSPGGAQGKWVPWLLPSFVDVFFLVLTGMLAFTPASAALLGDADTGWHIRNGEQILATHSVPHTDSFSYTKAGQPWYAWEWLYDAAIAAIHHVAGLNGVVLFSAMVIALTFALLFRFVLQRSGNFAVAVMLTLLSASAAMVHMLARPHILSWLFTLVWLAVLYRFDEGRRSALLWLPPLMLLWVNLHGGFILGLVLLGIFGCGRLWRWLTTSDIQHRRAMIHLALAFGACSAATLITPYGYKLHIHVYEYMSSSFLMNSINEFMSPNFHAQGYGYFELLILLTLVVLAVGYERLSATDLLLVLGAIHAGLTACRNIPLSAILLSVATAPAWAGVLGRDCRWRSDPPWLGSFLQGIEEISASMAAMERQFRGHGLAIAAVIAAALIALQGGRLGSAQVLDAHFDDKKFPVKAAEFIAAQGIHDHLYNPDDWSGYLIYRLYPSTRVFFDDRHDFYGEAFIKEYLRANEAGRNWQEPLQKYEVRWVLVPAQAPLATLLKQSREWTVRYEDRLAVMFARQGA